MKHSYWIPTNRPSEQSIFSFLKEIAFCQEQFKVDIPLFVLDSGDPQVEKSNEQACQAAQKEYPQVQIQFWPFAKQQEWVCKILDQAGQKTSFQEFFTPQGCNYGAMMNKIFLLARVLGFDVIHRRDSDTLLIEQHPYPLEEEIKHLADPHVKIVGSSYLGDWKIDIEAFIDNQPHCHHDFFNSLGIPAESHSDALLELQNQHEGSSVKSQNTMPDPGNFAIKDLFALYPCLPAQLNFGADSFIFRTMDFHPEYQNVFHRSFITHSYDSKRKAQKHSQEYLKALMKFVDYFVCYSSVLQEMPKNPSSDRVAMIISQAAYLSKFSRKNRLKRFAQTFIATLYPQEASELQNQVAEIVEECSSDYLNHSKLIKVWSQLGSNQYSASA